MDFVMKKREPHQGQEIPEAIGRKLHGEFAIPRFRIVEHFNILPIQRCRSSGWRLTVRRTVSERGDRCGLFFMFVFSALRALTLAIHGPLFRR
jgi:hypothetical protein